MPGTLYKYCQYCNQRYDISKKHRCKTIIAHENNVKREYQKKMKTIDAPLRSKRWRDLRKRIILADMGVCQRCLKKYNVLNDENLEVHHIKPRINYPDLIFDESNLITLCHSCNAQLALNDLDFDFNPDDRVVDHDYYI